MDTQFNAILILRSAQRVQAFERARSNAQKDGNEHCACCPSFETRPFGPLLGMRASAVWDRFIDRLSPFKFCVNSSGSTTWRPIGVLPVYKVYVTLYIPIT